MSALVDTCGWIEWLTDGTLAEEFSRYLLEPAAVVVPTLVQYELHRWVCRERDEATAVEVIGVTEQGLVVPLDTSLALFASELAAGHNLAMADAVVYATALQAGHELVTCDAHFASLPGVTYLPKN
ncbi:MAG: type II toxin-antitoxin system VapC family toxin [Deltaproteobacteria bacterium]|nr:type II toxin-antitoxin system VapC family toxin [Deltaproteobacteria bacterium]